MTFKRREPQQKLPQSPSNTSEQAQSSYRSVIEGRDTDYPCMACMRAWSVEQLELKCRNPECRAPQIDAESQPPVCVSCSTRATMYCPDCGGTCLALTVEQLRNAIVLVGARHAGKSVYLATLLQEMKRVLPGFGISVSHPDHESDVAFAAYLSTVVTKRQLPETTFFDRSHPLHLTLERDGSRESLSVVLYDPPGEVFEEAERDRRTLIAAARGVILLVDAEQVRFNPGLVDATLQVVKRDMEAVRHRVFGESDLWASGVRLAVVASKIDTLLEGEQSILSSEILYDRRRVGFELEELRDDRRRVHTAVRQGLLDSQAGNLVRLAENNFITAYFGVSSLGTAPLEIHPGPGAEWSNTKSVVAMLRPTRVMDPLLWLLDEFGILSSDEDE